MRYPSTVLICGKGQLAVDALLLVAGNVGIGKIPCRIAACPAANDRGYDTWMPSLAKAAHELGVPVEQPKAHMADPGLLLLSLEYERILPVKEYASDRLFNVHFSALPAYRGVFTSIWPILNGEAESGVTLHRIWPGIDDGPIVDQATFALHPGLTARELYDRLHVEATALLARNLEALLTDAVSERPQDNGRASVYTRSSLDLPEAAAIDLTMPWPDIDRHVRAFYFPEYQVATLHGRGVSRCRAIGRSSTLSPGTKVDGNSRCATYAVGDGMLVQFTFL